MRREFTAVRVRNCLARVEGTQEEEKAVIFSLDLANERLAEETINKWWENEELNEEIVLVLLVKNGEVVKSKSVFEDFSLKIEQKDNDPVFWKEFGETSG